MKGEDWAIYGYMDKFSARPGENLKVMVSTTLEHYRASVVRLGTGSRDAINLEDRIFPGRTQPLYTGSYVAVRNDHLLEQRPAITLSMWIYPTAPAAGRLQGLVTMLSESASNGWGLYLDETGRLLFRARQAGQEVECRSTEPCRSRSWYFIACSYDIAKEGRIQLHQHALRPSPDSTVTVARVSTRPSLQSANSPLLIGAGSWSTEPTPHATAMFDGKIDSPSIFSEALSGEQLGRVRGGTPPAGVASQALVAAWDFSIGTHTSSAIDTSPNCLHGALVNAPMRACTGHRWSGHNHCFLTAPDEYGAIHFHSDDIGDAGWDTDFEIRLPEDLPSGAYVVRLAGDADNDDLPFFVVPKTPSPSRLAFVAPTLTYLAYGNDHFASGTGTPSLHSKPDPADRFLAQHPELGRGLYDRHADGSGCCYSSRLRPLVNFRPDDRTGRGAPRHFPADLLFLEWLSRKGYECDVLTDEQLHADGLAAISPYRVLITGSHPEYCTEEMLDALHGYVDGGGRLMYLGGNGYYWVTSFDRTHPEIIEVRRGASGTRTWTSEPGELYHSSSGELGGLWRHRGRFPNELTGVGFSGQGGSGASGYTRLPASRQDKFAFVFRGVDEDVIGGFGDVDDRPAGDEVDRLDFELNSPLNAAVLATSSQLPSSYLIAIEDIGLTTTKQDAATNPKVRADIVYYDRPGGGAVFSVGSISWFRSIGYNGDDNNVSRVTENVLRAFLGLSV